MQSNHGGLKNRFIGAAVKAELRQRSSLEQSTDGPRRGGRARRSVTAEAATATEALPVTRSRAEAATAVDPDGGGRLESEAAKQL